ncbi:MAG: serine/threonine protein kinase, partial [Clostridium sp.]|nr:serine/threonine protein kinase [Clostridium sp.]
MEKNACLPAGATLQGGKYRIVRFIGAGGFGCTYEAVFELLGERVAIKEFFPHELCNREASGRMSVGTDSQADFVAKMRKKFVDEARTLFRYSGMEGVVKVTDVFEENATSYFVMDYIDGQSLHSIIKANGPLREGEALRIIREVGQALQRVHDHGCLHLDIKPDNIMLAKNGHPVLIDFGVSKQYSLEDGCNTSTLMGCTPGYAPLEQMRGNVRTFLAATDVYALAATLYTLLSGKTPPGASDLLNDDEALDFPPAVSEATRR